MAAKKKFTQIFIYFSKPLRLLYSLVIYEIVNFLSSLFTLCYFFLSFYIYISVPIYLIVHVQYVALKCHSWSSNAFNSYPHFIPCSQLLSINGAF